MKLLRIEALLVDWSLSSDEELILLKLLIFTSESQIYLQKNLTFSKSLLTNKDSGMKP